MKKGFTLIELLVVVLIIGILSAIALPQYQKAVLRSRFVQGIVLVRAVKDAQERYFLANGYYAEDPTELDIGFSCPGNWSCDFGKDQNSSDSGDARKFTMRYSPIPGLSITGSYAGRSLWPNRLYCATDTGNTKGQSVCKTYGSEAVVIGDFTTYTIN